VTSRDDDRGFTVVDRRSALDEADGGQDEPEVGERKPTYVEQLEESLEEEKRTVAEIKAQYRAALDEFENAKARSSRDAALEIRKGRKGVLVEMLEVLDNLDRAIEAAGDEGARGALAEGIALVREQFLYKLEHLGARRMDSLGRKFDPSVHQAVSTVPVDDHARDGTVVGVVTEGYAFEDSDLLRPAVVAVGRYEE
jgi:molecular chaperone GrpE